MSCVDCLSQTTTQKQYCRLVDNSSSSEIRRHAASRSIVRLRRNYSQTVADRRLSSSRSRATLLLRQSRRRQSHGPQSSAADLFDSRRDGRPAAGGQTPPHPDDLAGYLCQSTRRRRRRRLMALRCQSRRGLAGNISNLDNARRKHGNTRPRLFR